MSDWKLDTPVAFFVFNRPAKTRKVLNQIANVEPPALYIVADGPRDGHPNDSNRVSQVRDIIETGVDWECDLHRNYAGENLGLFERFTTGLRWIFTNEPEAIILEDDCLPNQSFFRFCESMLDEYRNDKRVMDITGSNYLGEWKSERQDYHFSYYGGSWGWATWRRSWEWYDPEMRLWEEPEVRKHLREVFADRQQTSYLEFIFDKTYQKQHTWDYPWVFSKLINSAHSVVPARNLVSNIGFGEGATNTKSGDSPWSEIPRSSLNFPVDRKEFVAVDREYDKRFHKLRPIFRRNRLLRFIQKNYQWFMRYID